MNKISAVIITYNEERNIGRCLESLRGVADEIVVVDSFSKDKTEEICQKYGVRFIKYKFEGHIEQKNWAAAQAAYDHVLSLDADEALSDELKSSIMEVKDSWKYDGYYFNRLTNYCGQWIRHLGWYPDRKLRLWDRRKGSWQGNNPHDKFLLQAGSTTHFLKGDLLHYSYYSIRGHIDQVNKFTDIGAATALRNGKSAPLLMIVLNPLWKFFRDYVVKLGFLDGYYGLVISVISAQATFLKYVKLRELIMNGTTRGGSEQSRPRRDKSEE
ncbi:MAG: glycosyltransferase family 2 protein [Nitrospinae bacterium]|nr:glycosyltransferase family 2 protein [Nitrospinota bacterium]